MKPIVRRSTTSAFPSVVLMENAGRQAVAAMEAAFDDLTSSKVGVLCGRGNNGGDGFVIARTLAQRGIEAMTFLLGSVAEVKGEARTNLEVLGRIGLTVIEIANAQEWELHFTEVSECDLIVDAIVGTGFHGPLTGLLETVVADVNGLGVPVVAIDLPTGVSADSHELDGKAIEASMTVTLAAPKLPLVLPPADAYAGDLVIADIGIPASVHRRARWSVSRDPDAGAGCGSWRRRAPADSHKGDFGRVLVVAGSVGRSGAAHLAAARRPALRCRPRHGRDAEIRGANRRRHGAGVHDAAARGDRRGRRSISPRVERVLDFAGRRDRDRARARPGSVDLGVRSRHSSSARVCRW